MNGPEDAAATLDTLQAVGETAALRRILPRLPAADLQLLGPGDDAAVVAAPDGRTVISTDLLVHGPDFRLAWSSPFDLGWKAAATNLADIAAMGAAPTALVVALAAPGETAVAFLEQLADGLREACAALAPGVGVVGGDLSASPTLTIAVTVFGDLGGGAAVRRSGARPGDVVAVAGPLGRAAAGLRLLFGSAVDGEGRPDPAALPALRERHPELIRAQLAPAPPIPSGVLAMQGGATAMIDISDGLLLDASRIAEASGVSLDLSSAALEPDVEAVRNGARELVAEATALVLTGGEDHSLLATFPPGELPDGFRRIGVVRNGVGVSVDGAEPPRIALGWDSFEGWNRERG
ncbi:MAG: thiamine-monophosphate kinase [Naasia sp.]|nr:thiamine-monophosphate kinase [Naasia sp.]